MTSASHSMSPATQSARPAATKSHGLRTDRGIRSVPNTAPAAPYDAIAP
jgi:hypothetical protein